MLLVSLCIFEVGECFVNSLVASSLDELLSDSHDLQNDFLDPDDMDSSMTAITYTDYNLSNLSNSESDNDSEDLDSEIADMINNVHTDDRGRTRTHRHVLAKTPKG